jgi:hypothetical protein
MVAAFNSRGFTLVESGSAEMAEGSRTDWRQLCAAAATETDSETLANLVHQLIKALDERGNGFASPTNLTNVASSNAAWPQPYEPVEPPVTLGPSVPE